LLLVPGLRRHLLRCARRVLLAGRILLLGRRELRLGRARWVRLGLRRLSVQLRTLLMLLLLYLLRLRLGRVGLLCILAIRRPVLRVLSLRHAWLSPGHRTGCLRFRCLLLWVGRAALAHRRLLWRNHLRDRLLALLMVLTLLLLLMVLLRLLLW
jgi:hypothetical protein